MSTPIKYDDGETIVELGDHVMVRLFLFLKRPGRISYIPGISPLHREMEPDGVRLVGVSFRSGSAGGFWVESSDSRLIKTVKFVARDSSPVQPLLLKRIGPAIDFTVGEIL